MISFTRSYVASLLLLPWDISRLGILRDRLQKGKPEIKISLTSTQRIKNKSEKLLLESKDSSGTRGLESVLAP
jgi:hypothetical protein